MFALLAVACSSANVVIDGAPEVGTFRSAFWTDGFSSHHYTLRVGGGMIDDWGVLALPPAVRLTDTPDGCEAWQDWLTGWSEASERFLEDEPTVGLCAAIPGLLEDMAEVDARYPNPTTDLHFSACDDEGICFAPEETYGADLDLWLEYSDPALTDGRYERALAAWSVEECGYLDDADRDELEVDDVYAYASGSVAVDVSNRWIGGTLDVEVENHGAETTSHLSGDFHVDWCEAPEVGATVTPGWI